MSPPSAFAKAKAERETIKLTLTTLDATLANHNDGSATLDHPSVEAFLEMAKLAQTELMSNQFALQVSSPSSADLQEFTDEYPTVLANATRYYSAFRGIMMRFPASSSSATSTSTSSTTCSSAHAVHIKLPRLDVPQFSGSLEEWISFRDMFERAIDKNKNLSKAEKLTYLKSYLTGEAARHVSSTVISDANYDVIWQNLTNRYQNDRELCFNSLRRLINQQSQPTASAAGIRTIIDTTQGCIRSLEVLSVPVQHWDAIIIFIIFNKLDQTSKELWEQQLPDSNIPTLKNLINFMEQRARSLAAGCSSATSARIPKERRIQVNHASSSPKQDKCKLSCDNYHPLYKCPKFSSLQLQQRKDTLKRLSLCFNCMGSHSVIQCLSKHSCRVCNKRHNTMIHQWSEQPQNSATTNDGQPGSSVASHLAQQQNHVEAATLATARIIVPDVDGYPQIFRCLMDGGSPVSFITESAARRLRLTRTCISTQISGIGATPAGVATSAVTIAVKPYFSSNVCYSTKALIMSKITSRMPPTKLDTSGWTHLNYLTLADPDYATPGTIDILLGSGIFYSCLEMEKRSGLPDTPYGIKSTLGWLVGGLKQEFPNTISTFHTSISLDQQVLRFWEAETIPETPVLTEEQQHCENHFSSTYKRDLHGRFHVAIPWRTPMPPVGQSRAQAYRRLMKLEKDFSSIGHTEAEQLRKLRQHVAYKSFMKEYEDMGHMSLVSEPASSDDVIFYIPHHFVEKESSTTTKLRVVFDASCKTSSGFSANDCMMVGPTIQDTLHEVLLRFRKHNIAFTADVAKMYRQILVTKHDASALRILWREDPSSPVREYTLNTVTYGTGSAMYLAVRSLHQLAKEESKSFPIAAEITQSDYFVDDLMSGQPTEEDAIKAIQQLISMCNTCGFPLRKWSSNSQAVLDSIPADLKETKSLISLEDTQSSSVKTLGVQWNPSDDTYHFIIDLPPPTSGTLTKRKLLSEVATIFDPLGWLAPVIITAKILLQKVWKSKVQWDEPVPESLQQEWQSLKCSLKEVETITIPRCILPGRPTKSVLCGFCDSSLTAFSAVVYTICFYENQDPQAFLVTSKTKVAPITPVTLPRLELCGAVLLSSLMKSVIHALKFQFDEIRAGTDSMIVLAWVSSCPTKWKTFVKHRVSKIQNNLPTANWFHVPGEENPADCASRGITPAELLSHPLWWNGNKSMMTCTTDTVIPSHTLSSVKNEEQAIKIHHVSADETPEFISKFSSYTDLHRTITWLLRFTKNCKLPHTDRITGPLTIQELQHGERTIIKLVQRQVFALEIAHLEAGKQLPVKSKLLALSPFIDESGILRVGGRLRHARISRDRKHPILLPQHHHLTTIFIRDLHEKYLHAGPQLMMSLISQKYWIIRAKDTIRRVTGKCARCVRHRAETLTQLMGDFPADRVNPSHPFSKCGVDYAGPFLTRPPTRSTMTIKSYLALFVCFATKAVHIEVVQSLSTDSFIAALRRFISRRGRPTDIYSDCGTNFVGANRLIKELYSAVASSKHNDDVATMCSTEGIQWHFNPPGSPHFGGLWEAGVRSVKYHLTRVMGTTRYTYEELLTLVNQIEALLNSRPLIPASNDPSDLEALTPSHFLHGKPTTALPEPDYTTINEGRLDHWKRLQQQKQIFWRRWKSEFISRMQQRPKWMQAKSQIQLNDMVIMKDDNLPPAQWHLGRVIALHPGDDEITRVVSIKTAQGQFKRAIHRLCLLPVERTSEEERD